MRSAHKHAAYAVGALAIVSGITSLVSWWLPSSAHWMDNHGFAAWPISALTVILLAWAIFNWNQSNREIRRLKSDLLRPLAEDRRLFERFKRLLPKDSSGLIWLRTSGDERLYRRSDVRGIANFAREWRDTDWHFINEEMECAAELLCGSIFEYCSFRAARSSSDPRSTGDDPIMWAFGANDPDGEEITRRLGHLADKALANYDRLYSIGSRLGI